MSWFAPSHLDEKTIRGQHGGQCPLTTTETPIPLGEGWQERPRKERCALDEFRYPAEKKKDVRPLCGQDFASDLNRIILDLLDLMLSGGSDDLLFTGRQEISSTTVSVRRLIGGTLARFREFREHHRYGLDGNA
jgi:hypothetical protein